MQSDSHLSSSIARAPRSSVLAISVLVVLAMALAARLAVATHWHRTAEQEGRLFRLGDSHSYWTLAKQIGQGLPYQYGSPDASIFRAPVYPIVLTPFTWIEDEPSAVFAARVFGCVLGTAAVGIIMLLAHQLTRELCDTDFRYCAMIFAGIVAALYPGAIGMSVVILSEAVFCPLMLASILLWLRSYRTEQLRTTLLLSLIAGSTSGLGILARPSWLLFPGMLFVAGIALRVPLKKHVSICVLSLFGIALTMSPWWIRNAAITGEFVPTTLQVGPSLYDGLHAGATGASDENMAFMQQFADEQRIEDAQTASPRSTFEYRINRRAQIAAIDWVKSHPGEAAMLAWRKFLRTWSLWPNGGDIGSGTLRLLLTIGCFGILTFALWGSVGIATQSKEELLRKTWRWSVAVLWLPALYFTLLHMIFVGSIRYREPALLLLAVLAGIGIAKATRLRRGVC